MAEMDLEYYKKRLLEEKERILKSMEAISDEMAVISAEDEIDDIEDMAELKIDNDRDKEVLRILVQQLKDVNDALRKIETGQYGIDEKTGEPIPEERLRANPAARSAVA
ncbi:TraR/DksA family transcriptional regulator [Hydrogenimonas urashimensis]|uniref:TraR/DksA family transcriptional regulator n=1 Tax=Hydrogenimonas urashimensis TaxID=2740515 RepID=UPI001915FAF9|nr:conjugal transfer protein TraR [Hydrogenimonas urashimensis]